MKYPLVTIFALPVSLLISLVIAGLIRVWISFSQVYVNPILEKKFGKYSCAYDLTCLAVGGLAAFLSLMVIAGVIYFYRA